MRALAALALVLSVLGGGAGAGAPDHSPRPVLRPDPAPAPVHPARRPSELAQRQGRATPVPQSRTAEEGAGWVCGDRDIRGVRITEITSSVPGCGIAQPVRVTAVLGISLDRPAVLSCDAATALKRWVGAGLKPAVGRKGGGVRTILVAASYACRPRNNRKGAKISEHAKGHAIDISGIVLSDGRKVTVADDWRRAPFLRRAYHAGCGIFGTTLGPGSDGYHENHMHFDIAHYRGGPYCH